MDTLYSVLNNDGYAVERVIHGPTKDYNNIPFWNWQKLLDVMCPSKPDYVNYKTSTRRELEELLVDEDFQNVDKICLVECILGPLDAPRALRAVSVTARSPSSHCGWPKLLASASEVELSTHADEFFNPDLPLPSAHL